MKHLFTLAALLLMPTAALAQSFEPIGLLPDAAQSTVSSLTPDGTVVVGFSGTDPVQQAFRWVNGTMTGLGVLPGAGGSYGYAGSADGLVVVGGSGPLYARGQAFRWINGTMTGLGFLPGGGDSVAA